MANITIKELLAADKVSELVDKINFNFDQLLLNGGGPPGLRGFLGDIGPIGPRGTLWFTAADLYTTSTSPSWTGTPERINDINSIGYPQFGGDPNRFLPVGNGPNPENTFTMGNINKMLRDGDLYIQEGDDVFETFSSVDGHIWEYDGFTGTWMFTGVNIKGNNGGQGAAGFQQWLRDTVLQDDVLYPKTITGQGIPRILVGNDANIFDSAHPTAKSSFVSDGDPQIAIGHNSVHNGGGNNASMANFTMTSTGALILSGSLLGSSRQINVSAFNDKIILAAGGSSYMTYDQVPDSVGTAEHIFGGGPLVATSPDANSTHRFKNISGHELSMGIKAEPGYHSIKSTGILLDIVLQDGNNKNVGIGSFLSSTVANKLGVVGNVSIGDGYKNIAAPSNGLIVEGQTGIGRSTVLGDNHLQVSQHVSVDNAHYWLNGYESFGQWKNSVAGTGALLRNTFGGGYDGTELIVSPNQAAGFPWSQSQAWFVEASTGYNGYGTIDPQEKIHIHDEHFLMTNNISGISKGQRQYTNAFNSYFQRDLPLAYPFGQKIKVQHYIGNAAGSQPEITLQYDTDTDYHNVGIHVANPKGAMEVRDKDNYSSVHMGNFNRLSVNLLRGGFGTIGTVAEKAESYVGFNAYVDHDNDTVVFKDGRAANAAGGAGMMMFIDEHGNMHFASYGETVLMPPGGGGR